jgi:NAD+ kinase
MNAPIVVLVAKRTSWQKYVEETRDPHVIELLRQHDPTVSLMKAAHEAHEATLREVEAAILRLGIEPRHVEDPHRPFATQGARLVMTVGGDGTLLSASHQVQGVPILGVNSAPGFSVGFFCGATPGTVDETLARFLDGGLPSVTLTRMEVLRNGRVVSGRVLNDALLCHSCPAATSRYILELGGRVEEQRSSGFWVGPAAGSTAAQRSAGGQVLPLDSEDLQVVVREPYTPQGRPLELIRELIPPGNSMVVRSKLYDGKLFMDGPNESEPVTLGDVLEFRKSAEPLELLCLSPDRHRC